MTDLHLPGPARIVAAVLLLAACPARAALPVEGVVHPFRQVDLSAPVASFIVDMLVAEGASVKQGQPLLQLYDKLEELDMKRAKAQLERREYEAKGVKNLYDSKIIPEAKSMEARSDLELARLNYETAAEQFRLRTLRSPIDGLVVERYKELGEAVAPSQPVFRIMDLSKVYILFALRPDRLVRVALGAKLAVHVPQLDSADPVVGEVVFLAPRADSAGLFKVKVLVENPDLRIRAGLKALVEVPEAR